MKKTIKSKRKPVSAEVRDALLKAYESSMSNYSLTALSKAVHKANKKWWQDTETGLSVKRNKGELLALIHSEISEALEGERRGLMDDKLPQYPMAVVEIVDAMIRQLDYLAGFHPEWSIDEIFWAKMAYNRTRADHQHATRNLPGGKKF